jgi:hypothetical protein
VGNPIDVNLRDAADSECLAEALVSQWQAIDSALAPIIGSVGVTALYQRSLHLSQKVHPWLMHERVVGGQAMDLQDLRALLVTRDKDEVAQATATVLGAFRELLASLVGPSLAERLLGPLWNQLPASGAAQDTRT